MKTRSMTGFGRGAAHADGIEADVDVTSVNRRQLDAHINLPRELAGLEPRIRSELGTSFRRGRVTVSVRITLSAKVCRTAIQVNEDMARAGIEAVRAVAERLGLPDDLRASWLLRVPGWVTMEPAGHDTEAAWRAVEPALQKALRACDRMRMAEGKALGTEIERLLSGLTGRMERIGKRAPSVPLRYRRRLKAALKDIGAAALPEDGRLAREVALMADRCDIREERTRLESHLDQAKKCLRKAEPCGRTLDFLAQEMGREINTLGAKAGDAKISLEVVSFKAELEQLREQVQNIE